MQELRISSPEPVSSQYPQPKPAVLARKQEVTVTDVKMPFGSMVWFMVKWTVATIPAAIILAVIFVGVVFLLLAILSAMGISVAGLTRLMR
jgi:hypothetical protein